MRLDALVINLNRFGDLLLSQPLLHGLHRAGRGTTLLCLEKYADTEGLLQFARPLLTVPDRLVSPEQADATRHELQAWARALRADVQADHIINLTPSMSARLLATTLAPAPEAVLGFGLDHKGRPRVDGLWPAFLHAAELRQSNAPFNLADMFRMTGAPLLGGLSGELLSQPGSGLLSELGTEARETARRLLAHAPVIRHGFIGMQLGASEKRRQWPVSHFVELGNASGRKRASAPSCWERPRNAPWPMNTPASPARPSWTWWGRPISSNWAPSCARWPCWSPTIPAPCIWRPVWACPCSPSSWPRPSPAIPAPI